MIIGSLSGISYLRFAARLAPIAIIGLVLNYLVVAWVYRRALAADRSRAIDDAAPSESQIDSSLLLKGVVVTAATLALFFTGQPIATIALGAAAVMLAGRVRPERVYRLIDWPLLVMFIGLFVIVHVFDIHVVRSLSPESWSALIDWPISAVSGLSLVLSNLVSNVPAVLLFKPIIGVMPDSEQAWLALAMSSTFAGNLTVLGSVANLIVIENARRAGTDVSFWEYLKVGIPVTLLTSALGYCLDCSNWLLTRTRNDYWPAGRTMTFFSNMDRFTRAACLSDWPARESAFPERPHSAPFPGCRFAANGSRRRPGFHRTESCTPESPAFRSAPPDAGARATNARRAALR